MTSVRSLAPGSRRWSGPGGAAAQWHDVHRPAAQRLAVVDLGSNSFHLVIYETRPEGGFEAVARHREHLPLADTVTDEGRIGPELADRVVEVARTLRQVADSANVESLVVCATHVFRHAHDGAAVIDRIRAEAGLQAEIISGDRESALVFAAAAASVPFGSPPALVVDLGGGSLDMALGDTGGPVWTASSPIGAAVVTRAGDTDSMSATVEEGLRAVGRMPERPGMIIATGGTLEAVGRAAVSLRGQNASSSLNGVRVRQEELDALNELVASMTIAQRQRRFDLSERRAGLLPAGVIVAQRCIANAGLDEMTLCDWGLREGIALEAFGLTGLDLDAESIRASSVLALSRRCGSDEPHCRHVARLALKLFDGTVLIHQLGPRYRELLHLGALAHDVGRLVRCDDYETHSAYLIESAGLRGFSPDEVAVLACLGRYHRRGSPKETFEPFARMDAEQRGATTKLAALLQVADALDRGHCGLVEGITVRVDPDMVHLGVEAARPADMEMWALSQAKRLFEKSFDRALAATLELSVQRQ